MGDDWDPFAIDQGPPAAAAPAPAAAESKEGAALRIRKDDIETLKQNIYKRMMDSAPWKAAPNSTVDLMWHTPTYTTFDWQHHDVLMKLGNGIAYIIFNRPEENNTLQDTIGSGTNDALYALHARPDIRVAVFTGEGRMYCAGGDPKGWQAQAAAQGGGEYTGDGTVGVRVPLLPPTDEVNMHLYEVGQRALAAGAFPDGVVSIGRLQAAKQWHTWALLPQFTINLANGSAMGGGVGCVCCCDYVISVKKAYFVLSEVKIGVIPATISPYVIAKIGIANAKKLFCCAENLTAEAASKIGLVQEVVETMVQGHKKVQEICQVMTECGSSAVVASKRLVTCVNGAIMGEELSCYTCGIQSESLLTEDCKLGDAAKKAGTKPPWCAQPMGYPEGEWPDNATGLGKGKKA